MPPTTILLVGVAMPYSSITSSSTTNSSTTKLPVDKPVDRQTPCRRYPWHDKLLDDDKLFPRRQPSRRPTCASTDTRCLRQRRMDVPNAPRQTPAAAAGFKTIIVLTRNSTPVSYLPRFISGLTTNKVFTEADDGHFVTSRCVTQATPKLFCVALHTLRQCTDAPTIVNFSLDASFLVPDTLFSVP